MPNFRYTDVAVKINNSGILAESAEIQSRNTLSPAYRFGVGALGSSNVANAISGPIQNSVNINYITQANYNPAIDNIRRLKKFTVRIGSLASDYGELLDVGGISGEGFLSNYSLSVNQSSPVVSQANYVVFTDFSGRLANKTLPNQIYGVNNISGIAHGYTTFVTDPTNYTRGEIYDLTYTCEINWTPTYILGRKTPTEVFFMGAREQISLIRDVYTGIQFSGQSLTGYFNFSDATIDFYGLGYLNGSTSNSFQIPLSGMTIVGTTVGISNDDWVKVKIDAERYF